MNGNCLYLCKTLKSMTTLTIQIPDKKADLAKQILKELGATVITDANSERQESPYNSEFVAKIKRGDEDIKHGRTKKIAIDDLWK